MDSKLNPGFKFVIDNNYSPNVELGNLYSEEGIPLYKLHGSVNWFGDEKEENSIKVQDCLGRKTLKTGETGIGLYEGLFDRTSRAFC